MNRCSYVCDDPPARLFSSVPQGTLPLLPGRRHFGGIICLFASQFGLSIQRIDSKRILHSSFVWNPIPPSALLEHTAPDGGRHVGSGYCACPGCRHWIRCDCGRAAAFGSLRPHRQGLRSAGDEQHDHPAIRHYLSDLRHRQNGNDADECLPIFLRVQELRGAAQAQGGRLLRFLLLRRRAVSPHSGGALKRGWDQLLREQLIAAPASLRRRVNSST
jgi:hypothetical protein